ncbi:hypothetical protein [Bacillus testis]|uniref:hypothetical protein n=1 Tax=Bacillus testis TaxID=1622072 RepID=UPI00067E9703|nr:hypothetical protein [Bacillus testis]
MKKVLKSLIAAAFLFIFTGSAFSLNASAATESLDQILKSKGYSDEEISMMSDIVKERQANSKNKRADYSLEVTEYYNSPDGKKYEVTDKNREQIRQIMARDMQNYANKNGISVMYLPSPISGIAPLSAGDSYQDSKLSVSAMVDKVPSSNPTKEYQYKAMMDFYWNAVPSIALTDTMALSWDRNFTGLASTLDGYHTTPTTMNV